MRHGDRAFAALELIPGLDLAQEDVNSLLLAELEALAVGLVVGDGNGAAHGWELNHTTAHLGGFRSLDRLVAGAEIHRASHVLTHAGAGAHRLVVHLDALGGGTGESALVEGSREGCTGSVDHGLCRGCCSDTKAGEHAEAESLLREGHGEQPFRSLQRLNSRSRQEVSDWLRARECLVVNHSGAYG